MISRVSSWINSVNTTSFRILASVFLMVFTVVVIVVGITFRNWLPTDPQITVLKGVGIFLMVALGLDVAQFTSKRFSDATYAAAKNPTQPVNVDGPALEPPATATDGPTTKTAPATDGSATKPAPEPLPDSPLIQPPVPGAIE